MHLFIFSFPSLQSLPFLQLLLSSLQESAGLPCICISLKGLFLFILCEWVFACMYVWVPYAYLVPVKAGKRHQVSWSWRYRHCELSNMGLKIRPWSSARTVRNLYRPYLFLVCVYLCAMAHVQRSKDTFAEASSLFLLFGFWRSNLRLKLGRQLLYPLSHLTGPKFTFVVTEPFSILISLSMVLLAISLPFKNLHSCPSRHDCIAEILIWISPMTGDIEYSFM